MSRSFALALIAGAACSSPARPDAAVSVWSLGPALPRRALEPGVAALGLDLVVAGGFDTGAAEGLDITPRVDVLDTAAGTWGALPDAVPWTSINLTAVGDTLYIAGGLAAQHVAHGEAFALDPTDRAWRAIAALPAGDERGASGVVTATGRIYLLGGASSTAALASCLEYDLVTQTWSHLPDLPAPRAHPAAMRRADGTLIVAGGFASVDASEPRGEVWALPPPGAVPRAWQPRAPMHRPGEPDTRGDCAYGVVLGQLVCAGGEGGLAARRVVESYDPYLDAWTAREPMPVDRAGTPGAVIGGRLFIPGGAATATLDPTSTLYLYTPLDTAGR
ncbi:MAG: hypothetical protein E6J90_27815 [Deltaproteobacteria bacterium]|nr:MAG: hypothetical protein E6J90_27815 [Deltaproteobacteria bacterium]